MKKTIISFVIIFILGYGVLGGIRFSDESAIRAIYSFNNIKIVKEVQTHYGKAVIFEDASSGNFGVAQLKRVIGVLWKYNGGSYGNLIEEGIPFIATGRHTANKLKKEQFVLGVKVVDPKIKYIAIGGMGELISPFQKYELAFDFVKDSPDSYQYKEVISEYVLFVTDAYSHESWSIFAFDKEGKLIADKIVGNKPRYIN